VRDAADLAELDEGQTARDTVLPDSIADLRQSDI